MLLFELSPDIALLLVYAIPIASISIPILLYLLHRYTKSDIIKHTLEMILVSPFRQESDSSAEENVDSTTRILAVLPIVYLAILLFFIGGLIGTFYTVMGDVGQAIIQGTTEESRAIINIVFMDVFDAGWSGSLPWYGSYPLPLSGEVVYHATWEWICFTTALGDNSVFFYGIVDEVIQFTLVVGALFLIPLLIPQIRKSFIPSLYLFTTGIMTMSGAVFSCLAEIIKFTFFGGTLIYGNYEIDATMGIPVAFTEMPMVLLPIALVMFVIFPIFGFLLWKNHYPSNKTSAFHFALYIVAILTLSFLLHMR